MTIKELLTEEDENLLFEHPANSYERHWDAKTNLWAYKHREKLGLSPNDKDLVVHHKNGNHNDNRKYNLKAMTRAEHAATEKPALKYTKCKICGGKHYAKHLCAKHYWLYITKPKKKKNGIKGKNRTR